MFNGILLILTELLLYLFKKTQFGSFKYLNEKINEWNINVKYIITCNMFLYYNHIVFNDILECSIVLNKRFKSTAGRCSYINKNMCKIEISPYICNSKSKIRNILLHEMCHAAVMLIDKDLAHGHGDKFKSWCIIVKNITDENITTYHDYPTIQNFKYKCHMCGNIKKVCSRNHLVYNSSCYKCYKGKYYEYN